MHHVPDPIPSRDTLPPEMHRYRGDALRRCARPRQQRLRGWYCTRLWGHDGACHLEPTWWRRFLDLL